MRVARAIRQRRDHLFYGYCRSRASQNDILPFSENSLKCIFFCLITTLFDYHCAQILYEVEEPATCMPMSPGCIHYCVFVCENASVNAYVHVFGQVTIHNNTLHLSTDAKTTSSEKLSTCDSRPAWSERLKT